MSRIYAICIFFYYTTLWSQTTNVAPILQATGNQPYCTGTGVNIATSMTIIDPDDTGAAQIYIQISSGYQQGQDLLTLTGTHPTISSNWDTNTGKLTLSGITSQPTYAELIAAILDVKYQSFSSNPSGNRTFSIAVGDANYLPSTGHFYLYVPSLGITWSNALSLAANSSYFGLQGYLATLTTFEEAIFSGSQASGTGWIGASDAQSEGQWQWVTGPEAGTPFGFSYWNTGEPNNQGDEDFAHITAPGVGIAGSWNDMSNVGESSGSYQPKGYIVEFGGMPGDPSIQISTSTSIYIPQITQVVNGTRCGPGFVTLTANTNSTGINWYTSPIGGSPIATTTTFVTPPLSNSTTYYVEPHGCAGNNRIPVTAIVLETPTITSITPTPTCAGQSTTISATASLGQIQWYDSETATQPLASGSLFITPLLFTNTTYYIEANNNGCRSIRTPVVVTVYPTPNLGPDEIVTVCANQTVILNVAHVNSSYAWSTGETTSSISTANPGTYTVTVTTSLNCSSSKTFIIQHYPIPQIASIVINGLNVFVNMAQPGDYEYAIDGITFQNSNSFQLQTGGHYIMTVREINGCGLQETPFLASLFPTYFTPNGDGINDNWSGIGIDFLKGDQITIFDRYGKIVGLLDQENPSWSGIINGKPALEDDYWFLYECKSLQLTQRGHFTLKR